MRITKSSGPHPGIPAALTTEGGTYYRAIEVDAATGVADRVWLRTDESSMVSLTDGVLFEVDYFDDETFIPVDAEVVIR